MRYFVSDYGLEDASPADLRSWARDLRNVVNAIERTARQLRQVSVHGVWDAPSGEAFADEVGRTPRTLDKVAERLRSTADAITPYADLLESSKRAVIKHDDAAAEASATLKDCDRRLKEMPSDDPDRPRVERERARASTALLRAERGFDKELEDARRDENLVAVKLSDTASAMGDPKMYDLFEGMSSLGESASMVGIVAKPVAVVGVADPLGKAGRRMFYDEGSYTEVAKSGVGFGLDTVSFGAGKVAKAAKKRFDGRHVDRVDDLPSKPVAIKDNPIIKASPTTSTATVGRRQRWVGAAKAKAQETVKRKTGLSDVEDAFADWEEVAGAGRVAKVSVVVKHSAAQTKRVHSNVGSGTSAADVVDDDTRADRRAAEEERRRRSANDLAAGPVLDPQVERVR